MSEITEFLKNQTLFVTGVTGFLGKVMLWKALKEAGEDIKIYAMVRSSKDASVQKRLDTVFEAKIFDSLLASNPRLKERVIPVEGDIMKDNFGMSQEDQERLEQEVTVIIHSAATTKFNEKLKLALEMNTLGVRRILHLAKRCSKLVSLVHISTCYVGADKPNGMHINEQIYPTRYTPTEVMDRIRHLSVEEAEELAPELMHPYPNSYSFTKALGEQIVGTERENLPICILRPSIVTASWLEPLPGWIDVLFGPAGLFLATGVGALKVMLGKLNNTTDLIPVDIVCNGILAAAWRNVKLTKEDPNFPSNLLVYHLASSTANPVTWMYPQYIVPNFFVLHRPKKNFGYPGYATFIENPYLFRFLNLTLHFIPAVFADGWRMIQGKKPFMLRATKKLDRAMSALNHFTTNHWFFANNTTHAMITDMSDDDKRIYQMDIRQMDWHLYFIIFLNGIRTFLLKEGQDDQGQKPEKGEQPAQEQKSWFASLMSGVRSYLVLISLGCLMYFFRQHFWILKLRAKKFKPVLQNLANNVSSKVLSLTSK